MSERPDAGGRRPDLSMSQLVASGLATVIAALAASRLGVVGTVLGAAVTSVVTTAGSAVLRHYLDRGKEQVLSVVTAERLHTPHTAVMTYLPGDAAETRLDLPAVPPLTGDPEATRLDPEATRLDGTPFEIMGTQVYREQGKVKVPVRRWTWPSWKVLAVSAAAIFAITIGGIVAVEAATGKSLSSGSGHDSRIIPGFGKGTDSKPRTTPSPHTSTQKPSQSPESGTPSPSTSEPATPTPTPSPSTPTTPAPSPSTPTAPETSPPAAANTTVPTE